MTVFIPTFNGDRYLERLLSALEAQETEDCFEVLIIDSGSTDETLEIINKHLAVKLVQISQSEFGHGKTRNLAARIARGTYIAYLSHDAVPLGTDFLKRLIQPLKPLSEGGASVQGVVGKHIARRNCTPSLKYGIQSVFRNCGPDGQLTIIDGSKTTLENVPPGELFYSDVCSATSRDFLLQTLPYQELPYSEDMAFARDLIAGGFKKAYQPDAVVEHSNDVTLREYPKRMFDETIGMRRVSPSGGKLSPIGAAARFAKETLISSKNIVRDKDYSWWTKPYWVVRDSMFVAGKWIGVYRGLSVDLANENQIARYSLEAQRK